MRPLWSLGSGQQTADVREPPDRVSARRVLVRSGTAGAVTFILLLLLAQVVVWLERPSGELAATGFNEPAPTSFPELETMATWLLFRAHGVSITATESVHSPDQSATVADIVVLDPGVLVVVVPAALVVAGFAATTRVGVGSVRGGVTTGAAVVVSYLPLTWWMASSATYDPLVVTTTTPQSSGPGTVIAGAEWAAGFVIQPDPVQAVLIAGVAYPLAFGGLGGFVAQWWLDR